MNPMERCQRCGGWAALTNIDKMRGIVGLTQGWVHVNRWGYLQRWKRHAPEVSE